ncbi:HYR domain-containing protein [Microbacterium sp.]|uniref:HYR domain-containing protein n=1 Tax=Microbacterium sp. TaxID=51671 RepID=UPI002B490DAB|nr:HYR domain-containing protein [Microbacterium sp.]
MTGGATAAFADGLALDGDGISPVTNGRGASIDVCTGQAAQFNVLIAARRIGNSATNIFANGSSVAVKFDSATSGMTATVTPGTITVQSNWASQANNFLSTSTALAVVTLPAQSAGGSGTVMFDFAGHNASNEDVSGNGSVTVTWTVHNCDTTAPTLQLPSDITAEATSAAGATVTYTAAATDETAPAHPAVTCTPASGSTFALGATTVNCSATDAAGNTGNGSFKVTVKDTTAPAVGSPGNIQSEASGALTTVSWTNPTATDAVSGVLPTTCSPASGSDFPVGQTDVACSATDAAGNTGVAHFTVTIVDTTKPALVLPSDLTAEATGSDGAAVDFTASATDLVSGSVPVTCDPAAGSTFALGQTTVDCSAADAAGNLATGSFTVTVQDTTPPTVTVPDPITVEATGPDGAAAQFTASATDLVDGAVATTCSPASGSTFGLGTTTVTCAATDAHGNTGTAQFSVTVQDTTPPVIDAPSSTVIAEATGPDGAAVHYTVTASDLVDGAVTPVCTPASGSVFALGDTQVDCTATDAHGNVGTASFAVAVQDTTPPDISVPATITAEATGPDGATVNYTATAADLVDGPVTPSCSPASGGTFALGDTTVTCTAADAHGNSGQKSFHVIVQDTTPPSITWVSGPADGGTYPYGSVPTASCTATDLVSGSVPCTVTNDGSGTGAHSATASATDGAGNTGTSVRHYTVAPWTTAGFYQPVDMGGVLNTVKAGSTVPLKFEVFAGGVEKTTTDAVKSFTSRVVSCTDGSGITDAIEVTTTGGTSLRYDTTAGQFVQNWQTPRSTGSCYQVTTLLQDGSTISALFKLK